MDLSYLQSIMEPEDFEKLDKVNVFNLYQGLFSFIEKYSKITDFLVEYFKANQKKINEDTGINKCSLLMYVAMIDCPIIKSICELGAYINYHDQDNWTALSYANFNNNIQGSKMLLEYDATTSSETNFRQTAFNFGSSKTREEFHIMVENIGLLNIKN